MIPRFTNSVVTFSILFLCAIESVERALADAPNIVLVMADDQGWGETGYYGHPVLKTPNLDAMAKAGLRFDRFYAGAPVCSPTRASVLTGRTNNRTGVESHGFALRLQEKTLASALREAGYSTGHFGKWHLNGLRGPGVPVLLTDDHNPGVFGFDQWLSVTNFFDRNPILSRKGMFEEFRGDSSEIVVGEALKFIASNAAANQKSFSVVWFGTPHSPFVAAEDDMASFSELDEPSRNHYGELVALDRSIGALRAGLRERGIEENTLVWYCSDNGGLPKITPETVGGLRGFKGSLYEGGLRVPSIIEWPAGISKPRMTEFPACTMDIFPTIAQVADLPKSSTLEPIDGINLTRLFDGELPPRVEPLVFNCFKKTAIIDNSIKLIDTASSNQPYELYDLDADPKESNNLFDQQPKLANRMLGHMNSFKSSLADSIAGKDYPEGQVNPGEPEPQFWTAVPQYERYFKQWSKRPEYKSRLMKLQQQ